MQSWLSKSTKGDHSARGYEDTTRRPSLSDSTHCQCKPCQTNAEQAERMLTQMINDCEQQDNGLTEHGSYRPDSNTFRQVITAWTKSGCADMAAKNGSRIINRMITEFPMLSPDYKLILYISIERERGVGEKGTGEGRRGMCISILYFIKKTHRNGHILRYTASCTIEVYECEPQH